MLPQWHLHSLSLPLPAGVHLQLQVAHYRRLLLRLCT